MTEIFARRASGCAHEQRDSEAHHAPERALFRSHEPKETVLSLQDLGWDAFFQDAFRPYENDNLIPARVAARHHGPCALLTELGRLGGVPAGRLEDDELPSVGDWVAVRLLDGERKAVIEAVRPRRPASQRKE